MKQLVLAFCGDLQKDPVSAHVLQRVLALKPFEVTPISVDGQPVLAWQDDDIAYQIVCLDDVLSHDYGRYAPVIATHFGHADAIILVNWHQGAKAPDAIFTVQTTGDMQSGHFSPASPPLCRSLFLAVERQRVAAGLTHFSTWMEATHWSGPLFNDQKGEDLLTIAPSVIDLEIGSGPEDWSNPRAADVLAHALFDLSPAPSSGTSPAPISVLCIGGTHFEAGFTQLMRDYGATQGLALSHILPNHWLVANGYDAPERLPSLLACAQSIEGGVDAIVFHDNLKGNFKEQVRRLAGELGVPALSHKKLRRPDIAQLLSESQEAGEKVHG